MLKNNFWTPPPKKKVPLKCSNQNVTMITKTTDDATMNVISWVHNFPSQNPF